MRLIEGLVFVAIIMLLVVLGVDRARQEGKESLQQELVQQGHAEYYLDSNNDKKWKINQ